MKKNLLVSMVLVALFLSSCGSQPASGYIAPQQINEPTITDTTSVFEIQTERINNCDGATPNYTISYKTIQAQKATFEVTAGAGGLVTGTPIPAILEVQLEAKITASLAKDYQITAERSHDLPLVNPKGTYLEHKITWKVTKVKGMIEVVYGNNDVAQVAFDKIANVELYDRVSTPVSDCSSNVISTAIPANDSIASPLPTVTETLPAFIPDPSCMTVTPFREMGKNGETKTYTRCPVGQVQYSIQVDDILNSIILSCPGQPDRNITFSKNEARSKNELLNTFDSETFQSEPGCKVKITIINNFAEMGYTIWQEVIAP
jgi:hypothetical protein